MAEEQIKVAEAQADEPRTFTQEEVDNIVEGRIATERKRLSAEYKPLREKADKYDELQEAGKTDLQKAQEEATALKKELNDLKAENDVKAARLKVSKATGVPEELLSGTDEDTCQAQAEAILKFAKPQGGYPSVRDAGEVRKSNVGKTRDQFASWFNSELGKR